MLHITDMTWGRLSHPSEMLKTGQEVTVVVLDINREKERVSLGLKQLQSNPWDKIEERFPIGKHCARQDHEPGALWRVRGTRGRRRRLDPRVRVELDQAYRAPCRCIERRPGSRSGRSRRQQGRTEDFPGPAPARIQSVGRDREEVSAGNDREGQGAQHDRLRRVRRNRRGHRRNDPRVGHELDAQDQSAQRNAQEGRRDRGVGHRHRQAETSASAWG